MSKIITQTEELIESKKFREQYISRVEVLDKVKQLLLIPEMNCMTIRQVAEYYEVDVHTIQICYDRNKKEIDLDGVTVKTPRHFKGILKVTSCAFKNLEQMNGKLIVQIDDKTTLEIPNRGIRMFPKRAILRMGMLLRDSQIAKEVRTQLLNITENVAAEKPYILTKELDAEQNLMLEIGKAFATGDIMEFAKATQQLNEYQKRHIQRIEAANVTLTNNNKLLTAEILKISDRKMASRVMRMLASKLRIDYGMAFGILYKQLKYRYGIDLKNRGNKDKPYIQHVRNDEWDKVQKTITAILQDNNINADKFYVDCKIEMRKHK